MDINKIDPFVNIIILPKGCVLDLIGKIQQKKLLFAKEWPQHNICTLVLKK